MFQKTRLFALLRLGIVCFLLMYAAAACTSGEQPPATPLDSQPAAKVGVVIDAGSEKDRGFNQYTVQGAQQAAEELGLEFMYLASRSTSDYEVNIENLIKAKAHLIITVGFRMGDATSKAAQRNPDISFAIVDTAFFPGSGCPETVENCYSEEGGLANVTSLMFAEDQVAYLAGTLAACMSKTGTIATVAGIEIPPVIRFVTGFESGARAFRPDIKTLHQYIPDFDDTATGKVVGQTFIIDGADVIFGAGGNTGNGGLLAAHEAGLMAIGVDVDQYFSYEEVAPSLLTSAAKNMDIAASRAVRDFAAGSLEGGIRLSTLENGEIGLAPYHDWEDRIPQTCKDAVAAAREAVIADPTIASAET
ncbi:MAG: BMP family ABC transporter substrate-binding protein [Chloroflexi bacterium]|nr:BMP family ABC transporter substrate-binding protein [Chloroflexota bacterium]MDL1885020.1 BMP family ABC transporter substrate-binding protein [Anaerolineae bacterium CFX8]